MENIFQPKKQAKQSSLLAKDLFRKVDPGNPLANATEEMKQQETIVFQGVAEANHHQHHHHHHNDSMHVDSGHHHPQRNQDNNEQVQSRPQVSFEITNVLRMAYKQEAKLGTGCPLLNDFFRGGFLSKRLYEVYGESGTGKTQFAIQLLLNSILSEQAGGLDGGALFVMAGKMLNEKRFIEMKDNFVAEASRQAQNQQGVAPVTDADTRERISLSHANNLEEYNKIFINLAARVEEQQIKLVVVDNIHAVCENFIKPDGQVDYIERSQFMVKHSKQLKRLAWDFNLVIVLLNNVVADVSHDGAAKGFFENKSRGQSIVPSLGLNWSNCINERIALKKRGGTSNVDVKRTLVIEKSSYMRRNEIDFEIVAQGIRGKH